MRIGCMTSPTDVTLDDALTDAALNVTAPVELALALALHASRLHDVATATTELLTTVVTARCAGTRPPLRSCIVANLFN